MHTSSFFKASFAYRLQKIIEHYKIYVPVDVNKFEVTLNVSVLQMILTICKESELIIREKNNDFWRKYTSEVFDENEWGFSRKSIIDNYYEKEPLTPRNVIKHLRHAVSHPNISNHEEIDLNKTGYYTKGGEFSYEINSVVFINSPDWNTNSNRYNLKSFKEAERIKNNSRIGKELEININNSSGSKKYSLTRNGSDFVRTFQVELKVSELETLVYSLSQMFSYEALSEEEKTNFKLRRIAV